MSVEDATNDTIGSVSGSNLSPHVASLLLSVSVALHDESNTLSHVEAGILSGVHTIDLNESLVGVLKNLASKRSAVFTIQSPTF